MVNIDNIRNYMLTQAEEDRQRKWIQVEGDDLDDALRQASIELGLTVKKLEYEIRDPGKKGTFGLGKSKCVIIAYPIVQEEKSKSDENIHDFDIARLDEKSKDRDGIVIVRLTSDGALLAVLPPVGKGKKATEKQAVAMLNKRSVTDVDNSLLAVAVKNSDGSSVKIGEFVYNPASDPLVSVDITDFEMK
ncbi:MAG: Jag N-terminal domain-containing protein, partial [Spirochaetota bacterium]|nr:Jag N-terminal domain-containing protein [Spirochaetota bacterium]